MEIVEHKYYTFRCHNCHKIKETKKLSIAKKGYCRKCKTLLSVPKGQMIIE